MAGGAFVDCGAGAKEYPGKLTLYVFFTCVVAATGGLIFGYDIGISGGVTSMDSFLQKFFPSVYAKEQADKNQNQYCKFDSQLLTTFTSSLYLAALIASFFAATVTRVFGRKWSMFGGGITFLFGAALNGAAKNVLMLILGRILLGIGVGFANQEQSQVDIELKLLQALEMYPPAKLQGMHRHFVLYGLIEYLQKCFERSFSSEEVLQLLNQFFNLEMLKPDEEEMEIFKKEEEFSLPQNLLVEEEG